MSVHDVLISLSDCSFPFLVSSLGLMEHVKFTSIYSQTQAMLKALRVQCYLDQLIKQPVSVHTCLMIMNSTVSV